MRPGGPDDVEAMSGAEGSTDKEKEEKHTEVGSVTQRGGGDRCVQQEG